MVSTYLGYQLIARDMGKSIERVQQQPVVERETAYYLENSGKVKPIKALMADTRLYQYAMKAHGLEDMTYAKAFMVKALEGGIDAEDSFVNKLPDQRYKDFAETFNFARYGETTTVFTRAQQGTVDKYLRQTLEQDAGASNEGVRLALYFERKGGAIETAYDILADRALSKVVYTALGIPASVATADIDKQAALLESRLDLEDFADPDLRAKFLQRFTAMWEIENRTSTAASAASILFSQPTEMGISSDVMMTLQQLRG